jgi:hypothetical protein
MAKPAMDSRRMIKSVASGNTCPRSRLCFNCMLLQNRTRCLEYAPML